MKIIKKGQTAILVSAIKNARPSSLKENLEEMTELAVAAGLHPIYKLKQNLKSMDSAFLIGTGKRKELEEKARELKPRYAIFDHNLSGVQTRNLEKLLRIHVLDRTQLILEIFARREASSGAGPAHGSDAPDGGSLAGLLVPSGRGRRRQRAGGKSSGDGPAAGSKPNQTDQGKIGKSKEKPYPASPCQRKKQNSLFCSDWLYQFRQKHPSQLLNQIQCGDKKPAVYDFGSKNTQAFYPRYNRGCNNRHCGLYPRSSTPFDLSI